ncbi:filamentous hemagglutinin outer membrane protein [Kalymmatonema gypsitolerans NIES-4073]|nr:filamentous hemagglutinin outer membrane protein [Scytonema sp. NIES-4073]
MNGWHLKSWFLIGSALSVVMCTQPIAAQVVPDNTLPAAEQTQVSGNPNFQIDGGARRGGNLFHSFEQFSIPTGGSAYFNNAADIQNILTRVTGGSVSSIDGLIRANGTANLFLLNPNGILFGPNASLNVGGSFVTTTADAIGLANGDIFSANPGQPLPSQLLNVNPNALFFNQMAAQAIVNRSTANNRTGLQVPSGQSLLLVGGNVQLEGGQIVSPGSRVELGAVAGQGTVGLSGTAGEWRLSFPDGVGRADISLSNSAGINVRAGGGGSITITTRNFSLSQGSRLRAGIDQGLGFVGAQAGNIQLDATEAINLADFSTISNQVLVGGTGNGGNINITTGSLSLARVGQLVIVMAGQGNSGSVNITARDTISFDGRSDFFASGIFNQVDPTGVGNAGNINITTGSLSLTRGASVISSTYGRGNTGSVNINARDTVSLDSYGSDGYSSALVNIVNPIGIGNAGNINITTGSLSLTRGASVYSTTGGQGNAGSVNINARDRVSLDGENPVGIVSISIFTLIYPASVGQGGDVNITTGSLFLTNGGAVNTGNTGGIGNAGRVTINAHDSVRISGISPTLTYNRSGVFTSAAEGAVGGGGDVTITTGSLSISDQGRIITDARAQGNAGNIHIQASDTISFDGGDAISTLSPGGVGRGGNIDITALKLSLLNNAQLSAATSGEGNAGNITVSADTVALRGGGQLLTTTFSNGRAGDITVKTPDLQLSGATSGLFAGTTSAGDAGNLTIQPRGNGQSVGVNLQSGAQISASTTSSGRGGKLTIAAPESITLTGNGSVIAAGTDGGGAGGNLTLRTGTLGIQNQAEVTVSSSGTGRAGSLFVDANQIYLNNQGSIRADTTGGGGDINLRSPLILLRNGSNITTNAKGSNIPGGNIAIDTRFLVAGKSEDSNISANSQDFRGGNVSINAYSIFGIQPSPQLTSVSVITATGATSALSGTLDVTTAGIDPSSGLVELPTDFADQSRLIATGCPADEGNSFVITGRGGLPPTPEQELDDDAEWQDRRRLTVGQHTPQLPTPQTPTTRTPNPKSYTPIIEATGWQRTPTGEIILVATTPEPTVQHPLKQAVNCKSRQ